MKFEDWLTPEMHAEIINGYNSASDRLELAEKCYEAGRENHYIYRASFPDKKYSDDAIDYADSIPSDILLDEVEQCYKPAYSHLDLMDAYEAGKNSVQEAAQIGLSFQFLEETRHKIGIHYDLHYSKTLDWLLHIWRKGLNTDGSDVEIFEDQYCDLPFLLEKGCEALREYLDAEGIE